MKHILFFIVISTGLLLTSCYQEPKPGIAKITVMYNGIRVPSAMIHIEQLGQTGQGYINLDVIADLHGDYTYEHHPALPVTLYFTATSPDGLYETVGFVPVSIKPDQTVSEILILH